MKSFSGDSSREAPPPTDLPIGSDQHFLLPVKIQVNDHGTEHGIPLVALQEDHWVGHTMLLDISGNNTPQNGIGLREQFRKSVFEQRTLSGCHGDPSWSNRRRIKTKKQLHNCTMEEQCSGLHNNSYAISNSFTNTV